MKSQYVSAWWKAAVPANWDADENDSCVTFKPHKSSGVLQVSAAMKEAGPVTEDHLMEFAHQRIVNRQAKTVETARFNGISVGYVNNDQFWKEWWLRSGSLMLYITYVVKIDQQGIEDAAIDEFIRCLEPLS